MNNTQSLGSSYQEHDLKKDIDPQTMFDLKKDIDPQTMLDFMEKCSDFGNRIPPRIVVDTRLCLHCDYGYYSFCNCSIMKVQGYWKGVKYESKNKLRSLPKPSSDSIMYPVKESDTDMVKNKVV